MASQPYRLPNDPRIPSVPTLPESVPQDDHRVCAQRLAFLRDEEPPKGGLDSEHGEEVVRDHLAPYRICGVVRLQP